MYDFPKTDDNLVKLIQKFKKGDGINNQELDTLIDFYSKALNSIQHLNFADRAFHFAFCEIQRDYMDLQQFKANRNTKNPEYLYKGRRND